MNFYYDDGAVRVTAVSVHVVRIDDMQDFFLVLSAAGVPEAVSRLFCIELNNVTGTSDDWLAVDNMRLNLI